MVGELGRCVCGSDWFDIRLASHDHPHGGVQIDPQNNIVGYMGTLVCVRCGIERLDIHE